MYAAPSLLALLFLSWFCLPSHAQIVNVESQRMNADALGWSGRLEANITLTKNTSEVWIIGLRSRLQYAFEKSKWLLLGDYNLVRANKADFVNQGYAHLRYTYDTHRLLAYEAFVQGQRNLVQQVDQRLLTGGGLRFKLLAPDSVDLHFYAGLFAMYEYERELPQADTLEAILNNDLRLSTFLNLTYNAPQSRVGITHITYYQPVPYRWDDFRIASETSVSFRITEHLRYRATFTLQYDARPPNNFLTTQYSLLNGITFSF